MPAIAPAAVALRHRSPPNSAGANCATAAKDKSPVCASASDAPAMR